MAINTNIKATPQFCDILSSVIGQMSDGIWENTRSMEKYWKSLDYEVDQDNNIVLKDKYGETSNPADFFANKIKQIVKIEMNDNPRGGLVWDRGCSKVPQYLDRSWGCREDKPQVTVGDCYQLYDLLKGRSTEGHHYAGFRKYRSEIRWGNERQEMEVWALSQYDATEKMLKEVTRNMVVTPI